jgi:hypothetical protein
MGRVATLAVALVTVTIFIADPVACVDGCTDRRPASQMATASSCSLCQRGVSLDGLVWSVAPMLTVRRVHDPRPIFALHLLVRPIDHPPRPA